MEEVCQRIYLNRFSCRKFLYDFVLFIRSSNVFLGDLFENDSRHISKGLWWIFVQYTLPCVVDDVSQLQLSQSYGRDRLLESDQIRLCYDQLCCTTVGTGYFFSLLFLFWNAKQFQSTEEWIIYRASNSTNLNGEDDQCWRRFDAGVSRSVFVLAAVSSERCCSDSWQLCWRMRHLDRNQVTWPIYIWGARTVLLRISFLISIVFLILRG